MRRPDFIARQSRQPSGVLGWIVGNVMARETVALNEATLRALDLQLTDEVLEVGFGHGRTLERAACLVPDGKVVGIDFSETMVAMARRRCRRLIAQARVAVECGDSSRLPYPGARFDKAYAVHTIYFWPDPVVHLKELCRVLKPGGRLALGLRSKRDAAAAAFPASVYAFYDADSVRRFLVESGLAPLEYTPSQGNVTGIDVLVADRPRV